MSAFPTELMEEEAWERAEAETCHTIENDEDIEDDSKESPIK